MQTILIATALFGASVYGHLCLLNPYQFDPVTDVQLSTPAVSQCGFQKSPCNLQEPPTSTEPTTTTIDSNDLYTFVMIKNEDHWNPINPGNWTINIFVEGEDGEYIATNLGSVPDDSRPTGSIYQVRDVEMDRFSNKRYWIQSIYFTNWAPNIGARGPTIPVNTAFFQCAAIEVVGSDDETDNFQETHNSHECDYKSGEEWSSSSSLCYNPKELYCRHEGYTTKLWHYSNDNEYWFCPSLNKCYKDHEKWWSSCPDTKCKFEPSYGQRWCSHSSSCITYDSWQRGHCGKHSEQRKCCRYCDEGYDDQDW